MITELKSPTEGKDAKWSLVIPPNGISRVVKGRVVSGGQTRIWTGDSEQELRDFAATLPPVLTDEQKATALFQERAQSDPRVAAFAPALTVLAKSSADSADKATVMRMFAVPDDLKPFQEELASITEGKPNPTVTPA